MSNTDSNNERNNNWKERELGAHWIQQSSSGKKYITGYFTYKGERVDFIGFPNDNDNPKSPAVNYYKSEPKEQKKGAPQQAQAQPQEQKQDAVSTPAEEEVIF